MSDDSFQCLGYNDDGSPCGNTTKNIDKHCHRHRKWIDLLYNQSLLKCEGCTIGDCTQRDIAPNGVCWYELQDPRIRPNNMEEIIANLMSSIEESTLIRRRLARQAAAHPYNSKLSSAYTQVAKLCQDLQDKLVGYRGWAKKKVIERAETKAKRMQEAMLAGTTHIEIEIPEGEDIDTSEVDAEPEETEGGEGEDD